MPYVVTQGGIDELVPSPSNMQATNDLSALGNRYTFFLLPANDHLVYALQDRFGSMVHALGGAVPRVKRNPGSIVYRWYPDLDVARLGIGATTAYWITHLEATTHAAGALASVRARSFGIRERPIAVVHHAAQAVSAPLPAVKTKLTWRRGARPAARDRLVLHLSNVRSLTIDAARAGLGCPDGRRHQRSTGARDADPPRRGLPDARPAAADWACAPPGVLRGRHFVASYLLGFGSEQCTFGLAPA